MQYYGFYRLLKHARNISALPCGPDGEHRLERTEDYAMKNVIITGATGMIGGIILHQCLEREDVGTVTTVVRRPTGNSHPKCVEVVHDNFLDFSGVSDKLSNQDVCFYCLGVYTGAVPKDEFRKITVGYTAAFAEALKAASAHAVFCFLSGQGADRTRKSRIMFARDKGDAENILLGLGFERTFIFRPGYIFPVTPRKEPNGTYALMRFLYKTVLSRLYPAIGVSSEDLARAMVETGLHGGEKSTLEHSDIRRVAAGFK